MYDYDRDEDFATPQEERAWLIASIQAIETQLGSRDRRDAEGELLSEEAFYEWRVDALTARRHMLVRLRELNAELVGKDENRPTMAELFERLEAKVDTILDLLLEEEDTPPPPRERTTP